MNGGRALLELVVVLVAARAAAELAEYARIPAVPLEILAGLALGPSALGFVHGSSFVRELAQLGAIVLLFEVGIEMDVADLVRARWACARVAAAGVALSLALGYAGLRVAGLAPSPAAWFLAAAIAATSVGVSARVFRDLGALRRPEARTVLGSAVLDDIAGLLILSLAIRHGARSPAVTAAIAVAFLFGAIALGSFVVPRAFDFVARRSRVARSLVVPALALAFGLARAAQAAGLAQIVGAFVAGVVLVRARSRDGIAAAVVPVGEFLVPVFFVFIGVQARAADFARPRALAIGAVLLAAAVLSKLAAGATAPRALDRIAVGAGMMPRGEVTLIFATAGIAVAKIDRFGYAALVGVVLVTSVAAPFLLRHRLRR
jgi:Kef-type K+ transport system membrane component KefB